MQLVFNAYNLPVVLFRETTKKNNWNTSTDLVNALFDYNAILLIVRHL